MADATKLEPMALDCYIECPPQIVVDLRAKITAKFYEGDSTEPTSIVHCDRDCYVTVRVAFEEASRLARLLCLKWCVKIAFESCGPGPEFPVIVREIPQRVCERRYVEVTVPVRFPTCDKCGTVYIMCVTATAQDDCGRPAPFGGYCKGEQIMVYPAD